MAIINHPESVTPELLTLLKELMAIEDLAQFSLAGGTSLALRMGYRKSIDIDFFTTNAFDSMALQALLSKRYNQAIVINRTTGSLCFDNKNIKIDFLYHPYSLLNTIECEDNLRFYSLADISAMKVNAVTNRGSKKDFIDLYALHLNGISLEMAINNFCKKYNGNRFLAIRSLLWFDDADNEPDPVFLNDWSWPLIKNNIESLTNSLQNSPV